MRFRVRAAWIGWSALGIFGQYIHFDRHRSERVEIVKMQPVSGYGSVDLCAHSGNGQRASVLSSFHDVTER
jgi:hypothetical protein